MNKDVPSKSSRLSPAKQALLERRLRGLSPARTDDNAIVALPPGAPTPLSFAQQRLWFLDQLDAGRFVYNIPESLRLKGYLNLKALQKSLEEIIRRHDVLRTSFSTADGQPKVFIAPSIDFKLPLIDLQNHSGLEQDVQIRRRVDALIHWNFDLSAGPLIKAELLRLDEQDHLLLVNMHHIISDGWSLDVFHRELFSLYEAYCENKPSPLAPLPIQYGDYAAWQRKWLQDDIFSEQMAYWKKKLERLPVLQLPLDRPRPSTQSFNGSQHSILLPQHLGAAIKALAQKEGVTLHVFFLAIFQTLLHRYTSQDDIVIGSPFSNRNRVETEELIGFFVNSLVLRSDLSEDPAFHEALKRIKDTALEAFANQEVPFDKVVEAVNPERDPSLNPLFQVMYVFQNQQYSTHQLPGLSISIENLHGRTSPFDLTLFMHETQEGLKAVFEYNTDIFDAATIVRLAGHFQTLAASVVEDPSTPISKLELFTEPERRQLLDTWNKTDTAYPRQKCVHELFEEQVDRTPDAIAVVIDHRQVTYRELDLRANRLANRLRDLGVGPDMFVAFCMERSIEMIVAILGILKAGGAYVPLDVRYPKDRLQYFLADTDAKVLITQRRLASSLPHHSACVLFLDEDSDELASSSDKRPRPVAKPDDLAYIMYTSGSTGTPKGVCIPHRGITRLVRNTNYIDIRPNDVFLQFAAVAFDASTFEIWGALLNGAKLVLHPDQLSSLEDLAKTLEKHGVTILWLTAGLFHQIVEENVEALRPVRQLLAGGDVLSVPHCKKVLEQLKGIRLINGYGPTECTTFTTCHSMSSIEDLDLSIPIGRPISNTQVYILDQQLNPVPVGVPGELLVGGDGLARGYLNSPDVTQEKFVYNPVDPERSPRLYKTGDLARYLPDGRIEFLGRIDGQIKIRGFRVEPGEIENVLGRHPDVRENIVIAAKDSFGNKRLVAYIVPANGKTTDTTIFRDYLKQHFPDFMVPSTFVLLDVFPLTPNGKVDRKALPSPTSQSPEAQAAYVAPRTEIETKLAEIWCEVLSLPRIGIKDNFFDMGGHSLLAVKVFSRLKKSLNRYLPLTALFKAPTIEALAVIVEKGEHQDAHSLLVPIQPKGTKPPIFWVHTLGGGGGGGLFRYKQVAELLGEDQPSLGIQAPAEPFTTIEAMASHYVEVLKTLQPAGPYHLAGYCFGGNVAFEMAQQLKTSGEEVAFLGLMEAWAYSSHPGDYEWNLRTLKTFGENIYYWIENIFNEGPDLFLMRIKRKLLTLRRRIAGMDKASFPELDEVMNFEEYPQEFRKYAETHWKAALMYRPKRYSGHITLFRVHKQGLFCLDTSLGWESLNGGGLTILNTSGNHDTLYDEPHVHRLSELMRTCLEQARERDKAPIQPPGLTRNQLQVWVAQKLHPQALVYQVSGMWTAQGHVEVKHFQRAFQTVINSSDALRTVFEERGGEPVCRVLEPFTYTTEVLDFSSDPDPRARTMAWAHERIKKPFNLSQRLFDMAVIKLSDQEYTFFFIAHHLICDGWSTALLGKILEDFYRRSKEGKLREKEPLPQFQDVVREEKEKIGTARTLKNEAFWKQYLAGEDEPFTFYGKSAAGRQTTEMRRLHADLGSERSQKLKSIAAGTNSSSMAADKSSLLGMFFALFSVYLHRVCGKSSLVIGVPFHNRRSRTSRETLGFFSEVIPVRIDIDLEESFQSLVQKTGAKIFEAMRHGPIALANVQSRKTHDVMVNLHVGVFGEFDGLPSKSEWVDAAHAFESLCLQIHDFDAEGNLSLDFDFNREIFPADQCEIAINHFLRIVDAFLKDETSLIGRVDFLSDEERNKLLVAWNDTHSDFPDLCVHEWFEQQALKTPEAHAVVIDGRHLSYKELNDLSDRLCNRLQTFGISPGNSIAISATRSPEMIVGVLAILKAGGAYVPLDPAYPSDRLSFMLEDSKAKILLTSKDSPSISTANNLKVIYLDDPEPSNNAKGVNTQRCRVSPQDPAYVIYTSGSTGKPKGVVMCHRPLVNLLNWQFNHSGLPAKARTAQFTSLSFDVSFQEIFSTLCSGGTLVLIREEMRIDPSSLLTLLREQKIERLFLPFVALQNLAEAARITEDLPQELRQIITAGEQLQITPALSHFMAKLNGCVLQNQYGPTESHVCTAYTMQDTIPNWPVLPPIGRPIDNTQIYLLDRYQQHVPIGVAAELHIGGVCLAQGYLNRPELTSERFVANPFESKPGSRLYKTGDLARWLPDGSIEFLGRIDLQVKIRGFRVELGEVEAALGRHPAIKDVAVVARDDASGSKRLIAYMVFRDEETVEVNDLRKFLKESLPDYMVPSAFVPLEQFPLTPSGKVDRRALPAADQSFFESSGDYIAPRNELESKLASIWAETLGLNRVGIRDNFFEIGGHSLAAVKVFSRIKTELNNQLPVSSIFNAPTIEQLSELFTAETGQSTHSGLVSIQPHGDKAPIFWVHTLGGGGGGGLFRYKRLAELLGFDQPSYGIQAPSEPFAVMEEMAENYIQLIKTCQPKGPYRLAGYCFGGNVAFEMARQLKANGEEVAFLGIIDAGAFPPTHRPAYPRNFDTVKNFFINFYYLLKDFIRQNPAYHWVRIRRALQKLQQIVKTRGKKTVEIPELDEVINLTEYPQDFRRYAETHWNAMLNYQPQPYDGPLTVFRVRRQGLLDFEPTLGWGCLVRGKLKVVIVPGTHESVFDEPHVSKLARQFQSCLDGKPDTRVKKLL